MSHPTIAGLLRSCHLAQRHDRSWPQSAWLATPGTRWRAALTAAVLIGGTSAMVLPATGAVPPGPSAGTVGPTVELPNGRTITPAGKIVTAADFPAGLVLGSNGLLFVAGSGNSVNRIGAVDSQLLIGNYGTTNTTKARSGFSGSLALDPTGTTLYAAGGGGANIASFSASLPVTPGTSYPLPDGQFAGGVTVSPDGTALFVTEPLDTRKPHYARGSTLTRIALPSGKTTSTTVGNNPLPVAAAKTARGTVVAVGNEGDGTVSIVEAATLRKIATVKVGRHPSNLAFTADGSGLIVVSSLDDRVDDIDTRTWRIASTVSVSSPAGIGAQPDGLALAPDGRIYVPLAQDNAVAVISRPGRRLHLDGRIPTAWWPTAVAFDPSANALLVAAGKGVDSPSATPPGIAGEDAALLPTSGPVGLGDSGTLERIAIPTAAALASYSAAVRDNNGWSAPASRAQACGPAQVKHIVWIVRENKTYDSELGDEPGGSQALNQWGRAITPNIHALAERSGLLTAFYADEDISDTGHQALAGGVVNDWAERFILMNYGGNNPVEYGNYAADAKGGGYNVDKMQWGPSDYLIDHAFRHGLAVKNFGHAYRNSQTQPAGAEDRGMAANLMHAMPGYGWDLSVHDQARAAFWIKQHQKDVSAHTMPALQVIYLPDDHSGYFSDGRTPASEIADNDLATGQIVDALSHSPYWSSSAVFVEEDDAQSGTDHVEQHRTVGAVISPWTKPGNVSTVHHSQGSMLRSIESLLHLPALTEVDATATPFYELWSATPNLAPYDAIKPTVPTGPVADANNAIASAYAREQMARLHLAPGALLRPDSLPSDVQLGINWRAMTGQPFNAANFPPAIGMAGSGESNVRVGPVDQTTFCR